jgi:hypothetical protein
VVNAFIDRGTFVLYINALGVFLGLLNRREEGKIGSVSSLARQEPGVLRSRLIKKGALNGALMSIIFPVSCFFFWLRAATEN